MKVMKVSAGILKDFSSSRSCSSRLVIDLSLFHSFRFHSESATLYLEYGVHGDRQWAIPRALRDLKDVNTPSVYILHLLSVNNKHTCIITGNCTRKILHTDDQMLN